MKNKKYTVCFTLGTFSHKPSGGVKMVFEYANRLTELGYDVSILFLNYNSFCNHHLPKVMKTLLSNFYTQKEPRWFELNPQIHKYSGTAIVRKFNPDDFDVVFATSVDTFEPVRKIFKISKKCYFIQGYENWGGITDEYVQSTYKMGFKNIVVSKWLKDIVDKYADEPSTYIKNPIDLSVYKVINSQESRKNHTVGFLYHKSEIKGLKYTIEVIKRLKERYPDLEAYAFGATKDQKDLPEWVNYTNHASAKQTVDIYNKINVWICGTVQEGFGLTGIEAMACGAALVSTNYIGVREYAVDGYNSLLSPIKDIDALESNVIRLFEDSDLKNKLVENGLKSAKDFSWDEAVRKLNEMLIALM